MSIAAPLRVLLTNDDGPPTDKNGGSPFVYPFALALKEQLGWNVSVVVPSSQKSWVGKSYLITETIQGRYYYPSSLTDVDGDGTGGEFSVLPRALKDGETMEIVLVDGTPATCANLALHSLFPSAHFDLILSGPNFGRNTSSAFALSSGTIGAAMAGALSDYRAIAVSFGLMAPYKGDLLTKEMVQAGIRQTCDVVKALHEFGWTEANEEEGGKVDIYSVNVPLQPELLQEGGTKVEFTTMARTQYGRLFRSSTTAKPLSLTSIEAAGPAAILDSVGGTLAVEKEVLGEGEKSQLMLEHLTKPLSFIFAPDIGSLINPSAASMADGTDTHALHAGHISITPLRTAFEPATVPNGNRTALQGLKWRL